ncbi:MAG: hypothetical protein KKB50_15630 [Planctomycetes bacterium]|nr:hypothetical protein [Planctomycetota bacterium]
MTPLHSMGDWLRNALALIPMGVVRLFFVALPVLLIVWVLRLPRASTVPPGVESRPIENLKLWAVLALLIQVLIYALG